MNTSHMKLASIALVAWAALGATPGGASVSVVVMILLALLAVLETGSGETGKKGDGEKAKQRARLWQWGFYGLLMGLSCWVLLERQPGNGAAGGASSLAASRGWPVADPAVSNHAPGAAGRCACGKQLGLDKTAAPSPAEAAKRTEAIKKRTMNPTPKGIPTANLPGIGPNAKHADPAGKVLFSETSRYDLKNRRTVRVQADGSADLFAYDPAGQITAAAYGQAAQSGTGLQPVPSNAGAAANSATANSEPGTANFTPSQTFAYDAAGNRLAATDGDTKTEYQSNAANQYTSVSSTSSVVQTLAPRYDKLGNLLHDDQNTYTWDADIHLLSVTTKESKQGTKNEEQRTLFRYDALHRRVALHESSTNTTTVFVHDGWNVIAEYEVTTTANRPQLSAHRTWSEDLSGSLHRLGGIGGLLSTRDGKTDFFSCFHYDSNGDVVRLSGASGKVMALYVYDVFGKTILVQGVQAQKNWYRFSTKSIEPKSGLAYYGFRYYTPKNGRWSSSDPMGESGGVNLYKMLNNDLVNSVDRLGLDRYVTYNNPIHRGIAVDIWDADGCEVVGKRYYNFGPAVSRDDEGDVNWFSTITNIFMSAIAGEGEVTYGSPKNDDILETIPSDAAEDAELLAEMEFQMSLNGYGQCYSLPVNNCRTFVNDHKYDGTAQEKVPGADNPFYDPGTGLYAPPF
jgi:RHS repeat-associated protein